MQKAENINSIPPSFSNENATPQAYGLRGTKNIVFAGTSSFAVEILKSLHNARHNIKLVITQPDKPTGRKKILTPGPVKIFGEENNLPIYQPLKINDPESVEKITGINADFFVVAAYGQKIGKTLLEWSVPVNVHGSLLPLLRGAAPIQYSLIKGFKETGVTTMIMNEGMDTGDMLLKRSVMIDINDNYGSLSEKLAKLGAELIVETINNFDNITPEAQDNSLATVAKSIKPNDTIIDFSKSALDVHNLIRGLYPKPNALAKFRDKTVKFLVSEYIEDSENHNLGKVLFVTKEGIVIGCKTGSFLLKECQPEGSKAMKAYDFAQGRHIKIGDSFS